MNRFFLKYKCENDRYSSTIKTMESFFNPEIKIIDWYIANNLGILIIDTEQNMMYLRLQLSNFFQIIECHKIDKINDWLNNYESNNF